MKAPIIDAKPSQHKMVQVDELPWSPSPMAGVYRRILERDGGEVARATTVVRYAPNSRFSEHTHDMGEEFLVLEGVFSDEHGDYPAGSYVRSPWGTTHAPHSNDGCTIFVKLRQMVAHDRVQVSLRPEEQRYESIAPGIEAAELFRGHGEHVRMERWARGAARDGLQSVEILVIKGEVELEGRKHSAMSWIQLPEGQPACICALTTSILWTKTRNAQVSEREPSI